jgi:hypothetical protein
MKNLFEATTLDEVQARLASLRPDSERVWGSMTVAQALAHCSLGMEMAAGDVRPPRMLVGRILGGLIKSKALGNDEPMRRNSPTVKVLVVKDDRDFGAERTRLSGLVERFAATGPTGCTEHPHAFFGKLTPAEWAELTYKHLDHHLRQFGA